MNTKFKRTWAILLYDPDVLPPFTKFRFQKKLWRRKSGCLNQAINILNEKDFRVMQDFDIVAMLKKDLRKRHYYHIIEEIQA